MARRTFTDAEKARALDLYVEHGPAEAGRLTGIPKGTIAAWASRNGIATVATEQTAARVEAALVTMAERKARLASDLMDDIERIRAQLFAECVERKVVTIGGSKDSSGTWEIVDIERDQPTFGDQKSIMTTLAIAVDKVQILTGEATERIDHRHTSPVDDELERLAEQLEQADA